MRFPISSLLLGVVAVCGLTGCAQTERKLGRGMGNLFEVVRWGDMRRSMEQTAYFEDPGTAYTAGAISGFNKSITRVGVGVYEIVTAPLPPYSPVFTNYITAKPTYPDNYKPDIMSGPTFEHDTALGFAAGDAAPFIPGSRFNVFR